MPLFDHAHHHHHHHESPAEHALRELKEQLFTLAINLGFLMDSLSRLQAAAAAQTDLVAAAQTNINTLEAALAAAQAGGSSGVDPAAVDAVSEQLEATNAALAALSAAPAAPTPPAPQTAA